MFYRNLGIVMFVCILSIACNPTHAEVVEKIELGTACCDHEIQDGMDFTGRSLRGHGIGVSRVYGESIPDIHYLCDVNFTNASLERSWWDEEALGLQHCCFRGANLTDVELHCTGTESCDFTDATIDGAEISLTSEQLCSTASYHYKNLRGFRSYVPMSGVSFAGFDLRDTRLYIDETCDITDADIRGASIRFFPSKYRDKAATGLYPRDSVADFLPRMIQSTKSYKEGTLEGCGLSVNLPGLDFSGLNLTNARFGVMEMSSPTPHSTFHDAVITGADCRNLTWKQIQQTWNYKHDRMKGIIVSEEVRAALEAEKAAKEETSTTGSATTSADTTETSNAAKTDTTETSPESSKMLPETNETSELGSDTSAVPQPES